MILAIEIIKDDLMQVTNFLSLTRIKFLSYDSSLFNFNYYTLENNVVLVQWENKFIPIYYLSIVFAFINLWATFDKITFVVHTSRVLSLFFLAIGFFWSSSYFKFLLWAGLKKKGFKGSYKFIKLERAISETYFKEDKPEVTA